MGTRTAKTPWSWRLYPLYGLRISKDDGFVDPLWGDATLVSREKTEEMVRERCGPGDISLLMHGRLSEALGDNMVGNRDSVIELPPDSYVAVKFSGNEKQSERRAKKIRTLLSATRFLRGLHGTAFCGNPREYTWHVVPNYITIWANKPVQSTISPWVNPSIVQRPLTAEKNNLRASIREGTPVCAESGSAWDLYAKHGICELLNSSQPSKLQQRIISGSLLTLDACCAPSNFWKLRGVVTAYEVLLATREFHDIAQKIGAFAVSTAGIPVNDILEMRHELTHRPEEKTEQDLEKAAIVAVHIAWLLIDVATAFAEKFGAQEFDDYVSGLVLAAKVDTIVQSLTKDSTSAGQRKAFHAAMEHIKPRLTLNVNMGSE